MKKNYFFEAENQYPCEEKRKNQIFVKKKKKKKKKKPSLSVTLVQIIDKRPLMVYVFSIL
jgi:hypothetical protein